MSQGKPRKIAMKNNGQLMRGGEAAAVAASSSSSSATREGRRRRDSSLVSPPPMMVQERVLEGLERASEEEEQQQEENQELEPGMMLRQPLDVVATIDSWTADWMVQEQVDKREAELVESWLSRMLSKVLKMEEEENVAEEQQQQQQHSSLPLEGCGLRGAGLDRKRLMERGMPANHIDFVYRALYAHSAGFYETLHGGQGFKVDAEEMERLSVAFKLLMNLMQQGTTDAAAAIIPALYSSPDDASKLDGINVKENKLFESRSQLEVKSLLMVKELRAEKAKTKRLEAVIAQLENTIQKKDMAVEMQMKVDWHTEKMHLVEQLDAANRLLVEEKQCTTQLRKQSQRYVEEVTSVLADREVNANINAQNQQMAAEQLERATEMLISTGNQIKSLENSLATSKAELMDVQERTAELRLQSVDWRKEHEQFQILCKEKDGLLAKQAEQATQISGLQRENGNLDLVVAKLRVKIIELEKEIGALSVQLLDMDESLAESVFVSSTVRSTR
ncbi:unnamed protein product [Sphagnum jensenii]|uniref:Uncharacterized protein n=1 Tax=Sphagnum jensenii TaxID=128206 RepID=A0ABP1A474_9BRYO